MPRAVELIQERVRFGEGGRLSGVLHYPVSVEPERAVLLCPPHPNFAGDMDNNVVKALAERLGRHHVVLRFDYRGVGESRITLPPGVSALDYWEDVEQQGDFADALTDTRDAATALQKAGDDLRMVAVGYSFGAAMAVQTALADARVDAMVAIAPPLTRISFEALAGSAKPCLMLSGKDDFVYDANAAAGLARSAGDSYSFEMWDGVDHFFRGQEPALSQRVAAFISSL